jgi:hypothetical protein
MIHLMRRSAIVQTQRIFQQDGVITSHQVQRCNHSTASNKPSKKTEASPASSLEFYTSSSSDDDNDPTFDLSKELPKALTTALKTAISNMKWPAVEKPTQAPRPPKQVLGLACPRKQLSFDDKRKKASKGKHDYEGKGKKPME